MKRHLLDKVWDLHKVDTLSTGQDQIFIGLHLIHEVTSPQAFAMLRQRGLKVLYPHRTFATVDHIVPTDCQDRPFPDALAEEMIVALEENTAEHNITFFGLDTTGQGIVHIIGPELGLTQPGMTVACGDSHTATHGAFGALAFGIGTSQIRDVLATQTMAMTKPKVRLINICGSLDKGVFAKDIVLRIIRDLGVKGGIGHAYEYKGSVIDALSMEERLTICNMSIEGGARFGYVNPDQTTIDYLRGRRFSPQGEAFDKAAAHWLDMASDTGAAYDDEYTLDADEIEPMVTWGINPGQAVSVSQTIPTLEEIAPDDRGAAELAYQHMQFESGTPIAGKKIDVVFIGSCTNGRISDLREAAKIAQGNSVAPHVTALVVPGSMAVSREAEKEGLHDIFQAAGFQWRRPGCSMCLAMNPDRLQGDQLCASSSNRNFIGRQGSAHGRTLLMSPAMAAAAALSGEVSDVRKML
jgi:3-isopropylmalate/(R)-2-methylmalate dehydratase large subunit